MKQALALVFCLALCSAAFAQDPNLILTVVTPADAQENTSFAANVNFDNTSTDDCDGWSFGVCHDGAVLALDTFTDSALTSTINGGSPPGFGSTTLVDAATGGTQGVVIDLFGIQKLAPGTGYNLVDMGYSALEVMADTATSIAICNTLGNPAVADVIVIGGGSITPTENPGDVMVLDFVAPPAFTLRVVAPAMATSDSDFDASVEFDNVGPNPIDGWSFGVCHDGAALTLNSFADSALVTTINAGAAPGFGATSLVDPATGGTQGIVIDLFGINKLDPGTGFVFVDMNYTATTVADGDPDVVTTVAICGTLGNPPVADVIVDMGASVVPQEEDATVTIVGIPPAPEFVRGECNGDGMLNIADGIWLLNMLFQGGTSSTCVEACDANDDGGIDAADAMFIFEYRLLAGPPPPAPWPDCGVDPDDPLGADCASFNCP